MCALTHGLSEQWARIARASTTSEAIHVASLVDVLSLRLPDESRLSLRAKRNIHAVIRVYELDAEPYTDEPQPVSTSHEAPTPAVVNMSVIPNEAHASPPRKRAKQQAENVEELVSSQITILQALRPHVDAVRAWAAEAAHTTPPKEHISAIAKHGVSLTMSAIFGNGLSLQMTAALVQPISEIGVRYVQSLVELVLKRCVNDLKTPAPREFMSAIVSVAERHWRAALKLFDLMREAVVSPPAAEVLVRVASVLQPQPARQALAVVVDGVWGEDGVRVVDTLVNVCKGEPRVATDIAKGLEKNVHGLEKSLRFGKLLLVAVRDVPNMAKEYPHIVRNVAAASKVFLAKRALSLLPKQV